MKSLLRHILCGVLLIVTAIPALGSSAPRKLNIWQGVRHHHRVTATLYLAQGDSCPAIVVCPGGSYFWHDMQHEGKEVGEWLSQNGISALVLHYRTAGVPAFLTGYRLLFKGRRYPAPQDDLRRALRLVRDSAANWKINPERVGAMGFSAGGHLVMSAAELFAPADRPAFVAPIYPVVTMSAPCVHRRSRRALLGDSRKHNKRLRDSLSLELHVPVDCPPVFLVNCKDDPIVKYQNSELLDSALTAKGVPHKYLQYRTGGHGFGTSETKGSAECRQWKAAFLSWLRTLWE